VIPETAILQRVQLCYVAVVDSDGIARLRIVRTGSREPDGIEVLAGLSAGERILALIPGNFRSGTPVTPVE
jgi:multidrug efflux pump subunit AcrA (membrane-fusion protein)